MSKITVVGLGYVGLPLALLAKEKGHKVVGVDLDSKKVELIGKGVSPIEDTSINEQLKKVSIKTFTEFSHVTDSDIVIICVPTPVENATPNLEPLKGAVESVARKVSKDTLVIIESTINPGVCDDIVQPLLESSSGLEVGKDVYLSHCPERINPGDEKWTVRNISRVVGSNNKEGLSRSLKFYESIIEADVKPMGTIKEAEAVKVVENSFRDINIAFVNELAMSFHKMGINLENVIDGAATKPFAFMPHRPGCGVGGHCIPVDPYYLIEYARGFGFDHDFLSLARRINNGMPLFTVEILQDAMNSVGKPVNGEKIALLGLAYKPNVDDDRESPAYEIYNQLKKLGANVVSYDPHILRNSDVDNLDEALQGATAIVLATGHAKITKELTLEKLHGSDVKVIIDGRNTLKSFSDAFTEAGIIYRGIGV